MHNGLLMRLLAAYMIAGQERVAMEVMAGVVVGSAAACGGGAAIVAAAVAVMLIVGRCMY
jgi:hypothetical protein